MKSSTKSVIGSKIIARQQRLMHEASLAAGLMRQVVDVARLQNVRRVRSVTIKLGAFSGISEDHLREHFELASQGSVAEGASLHLVTSSNADTPETGGLVLDSLDVED